MKIITFPREKEGCLINILPDKGLKGTVVNQIYKGPLQITSTVPLFDKEKTKANIFNCTLLLGSGVTMGLMAATLVGVCATRDFPLVVWAVVEGNSGPPELLGPASFLRKYAKSVQRIKQVWW